MSQDTKGAAAALCFGSGDDDDDDDDDDMPLAKRLAIRHEQGERG